VTDSTGATVPGATVTITNIATNEKRTAQSNSAGDYSFVSLVPAAYKVEVQKTSFKRFVRDQVSVQVNSAVRVDASLAVGAATETVEVTTETPLLQTDSGSVATVVEGKTVNEMPLNGRNSMNLLALAPNVVPLGNSMGATTLNGNGHTQVAEWADYSIDGGAGGQNAMYVDGAPMNVLGGSSIGYVPAQDSVQEFNVTTNSSEADFGRFSGGVINMTTKSGTNSWHGTAYEYLRNNVLNANAFFTKQTELGNGQSNTRGQWNQNQYGGVFSGPIKKDKAFFMFNYEAFKARTASNNGGNVPTNDMQAGWIYGAASQLASIQTYCASATSGTSPDGTANSVKIPSSCWDATSAVIKTEYPAPKNGSGQNNFSTMAGTGTNDYSYNGRVDYNLSEKNRLFGRYTASNIADLSQETLPGGKKADGSLWHIGGGFTVSRTMSGVLGDTYTINPTTILDARLSYMRWSQSSANPTTNMDMSIFGGAWGTLQKSITETTNPSINFNGSDWTGGQFRGTGDGSKTLNDNEGLAVSLTKIAGKHSLKIGSEDRLMDQISNAPPWGWIGFDITNNYFTQNSWANFLLGLADDSTISNYREVGSFNTYQGYYVNDHWQATRKLTVTAGLRWELPGNIKEKRDRQIVLIPGLGDTSKYWTSPTGKYTGATSIAALVNSSVYSDRGTEPAKHDLLTPHVGLAYRLSNNDVIRGGYGYNILPPDSQSGMFPQNFSMNTIGNSWNVKNGPSYRLSNPFPTTVSQWANGLQQPGGRATFDMTQYVGNTGLSAPVPTSKVPHTQQWNLGISHQFKGDLLLEIGYSGSRGTSMPMGNNLNELQPKFWADQTMPLSHGSDCGSTTGYAIWGSSVANAQCARPYPAYGSVKDTVGNIGSYSYNSLPIKLEKRFKSGGLVGASYVWSKAIGNVNQASGGGPSGPSGGVQDWYNMAAEHAITSYDVPQRLIVSYVLNLPFGKGQKFLSDVSNGVARQLISGWAVNGITTFQKGFPLMFGSASYQGRGNVNIPASYGAGSLRPNVVAGCNKWMSGSVRSHVLNGTPILNANCWSAPTANTDYTLNGTNYYTTLGNQRLYEGDLRAPGMDNWDLSAVKKTNITEKINLEFRMEFFNLFNHMQFPAEATGVGSSNGGGFGAAAFGVINSSSQNPAPPRIGQASLRLSF
jgi:hypothetical protein